MGGMLGGGSGGGGAVVGGPSPAAANIAGFYQAQAAQNAADAAQKQTNNALQLINQQYINAVSGLKPYTTTGVQALDSLNQYLGLDPYNPGTAPNAPIPYSPTKTDVLQYIKSNLGYTLAGKDGNIYADYGGIGSRYDGATKQYIGGPPTGQDIVGYMGPSGQGKSAGNWGLPTGPDGIAQYVYNKQPDTVKQIQDYLTQTYNDQNKTLIQQQQEEYNQQMDMYNQANDLYNKYKAQGPLTADQVQAKLAATPGYEWQLGQGIQTVQNAAASKGIGLSGNTLQALANYGQGLASQTYGQTLSQLASLAGAGQSSATALANFGGQTAQSGASLYSNLGDTLANSALAQGNAMAQAELAANQRYQVIGGNNGGGGLAGLGSILGGAASLIGSGSGGSGLLGLFSSKELKDKVETPSTKEILDRVNELDIDKWKYKNTTVAHLGPYAEDFKEKFGVGDGQTINLIDVVGVLLASVKELNRKIDVLSQEVSHGD